MNHLRNTRGFTLIELMLAMSFLSMLLLAIAMTTMQISRIYTKGITLREVNQVGRSVTDDLRRTVAASVPFDTTLADTYVVQPDGSGRLCLGGYSYVWNTAAALKANSSGLYKYNDGTAVHLAKVNDQDKQLCMATVGAIDRTKSTELLTSGDRELVLHNLKITAGAKDLGSGQGQQLYSFAFSLGTATGDEDASITSTSSCKSPADTTAEGMQDYCSVNKFEVVVRAGDGSASINSY